MRPAARYSIIALAALATGFVAVSAGMFSASFALARTNPEAALALDGDNPDAIIRRAERLAQAGGESTSSGDQLFAAARDSIAALPLNAPAFRLFASTNASSDELDRFKALVAMSDRLSRRDLGTQLFLIETAVEDDDVASVLYHYDNAMRMRESSRALLLPVLAAAIKSPAIRAHLQPYLKRDTPWLGEFLRQAVATTPDSRDVVALLIESGGMPEGDFYQALHSQLLTRLVSEGRTDFALRYYRSLDGADPASLASLAMTDASTNARYTPVSWQRFEIAGVDSLFLVADDGDYELSSTFEPGFSGPIMRKVAAITPGSYTFSARQRADDFAPDSELRWQIECIGGERKETVLNRTVPMENEFTVQADLEVPEWCESQIVTAFARIGYDPRDTSLTISSPSLARR